MRCDVVLLEDGSEMGVCCVSNALSLRRNQEGFARICGEEVITCLQDGGEVAAACETNRERAMNEVEIFLGRVGIVGRLQTDVEEADTV